MSFYGNVYYLAEQAFAKYAFRNNGIDDIVFPDSDKIMNERLVDASDSNQGLSIDTGNRWIALTSSPEENANGYTMWHNKPDTENLTGLECFSIVEKRDISPETKDEDIIQVKFSDYLKIPYIHYDTAGHVSTVQGASYYKMPEDPTKDLLGRMNDIDGKDNDPDTTSLKHNLETRMNLIDGADNTPAGSDCLIADLRNDVNRVTDLNDPTSLASQFQDTMNTFKREYLPLINQINTTVNGGDHEAGNGLSYRVWVLEQALLNT